MRALATGALALWITLAVSPAHADRAQARALVEEGALLQARGEPDQALVRYERALEADPDYLVAYEAAAELWMERGRDEDVISHFERVTTRHPEYAFGWYTLGHVYRRTGRPGLAVAAYRAYIDLRPGEAEPYFGLGMAHKSAGHAAEAIGAFERYVELETLPAHAPYVEQARREIAALRQALAEGGDGAAEAAELAEARRLVAEGRPGDALAVAERARPASGRDALALLVLRAEILVAQGRAADARRLAWAALAAAPAHPAVHRLLARVRASR